MGRLATISTCQLNQWALDFDGNRDRILEAIRQAKAAWIKMILTPELAFLDTAYSTISKSSTHSLTPGDCGRDHQLPGSPGHHHRSGLPVRHNDVPHNARGLVLNGKISCHSTQNLTSAMMATIVRCVTSLRDQISCRYIHATRLEIQELTDKLKYPLETSSSDIGCYFRFRTL